MPIGLNNTHYLDKEIEGDIRIYDSSGNKLKELEENIFVNQLTVEGRIDSTIYNQYMKKTIKTKTISINNDELNCINGKSVLTENETPQNKIIHINFVESNGIIIISTDTKINPENYLISFDIYPTNNDRIHEGRYKNTTNHNKPLPLKILTEFNLLTLFPSKYGYKSINNIKFLKKPNSSDEDQNNSEKPKIPDIDQISIDKGIMTKTTYKTSSVDIINIFSFHELKDGGGRYKKFHEIDFIDRCKDVLLLQKIKKIIVPGDEEITIEIICSIDEKITDFSRMRQLLKDKKCKPSMIIPGIYIRIFFSSDTFLLNNHCRKRLLEEIWTELIARSSTTEVVNKDKEHDVKSLHFNKSENNYALETHLLEYLDILDDVSIPNIKFDDISDIDPRKDEAIKKIIKSFKECENCTEFCSHQSSLEALYFMLHEK